MTEIKLRNLLLLVRQNPSEVEPEEKMGSIFIPKTARTRLKQATGTVVATGKGTSQYDMEVKVGDEIIYDNRRDYITIDGMVLLSLVKDVFFIIKKDE